MNKIQQLIQQYCPNGVEFKELGEVMNITRGASPRPINNFISNDKDGVPWIKIGDVNLKSKFITQTKEKITKVGAEKSRFLKKGDFVLSNSMSFGRPYILAIDGCIHDGWISMQNFENVLIADFLYYILSSDISQNYWKQKASSGTVQNLNADIVRATKIPIPPLTIQQEIVTILETFTALDGSLQAELEARRKQYEHYRNQLLNFEGKEVEWRTLGGYNGIAEIGTGSRNTVDAIENGKYPFYVRSANIMLIDKYEFDEEAILTSGDGVGVGKILHYVKGKYGLHQRAYRFRIKNDEISTKYIFYYMKNTFEKYILGSAVNSSVTSVRRPMLEKYKIPIPPLSEQLRIVSILDKFDALVNNELPAEIAARRKQYEYYREKLLTFK